MKITDVRVIGKGIKNGHTALVEVESDDGLVGIGATSATVPVIAAFIEGDAGLRPLLLGQDPTNTNLMWRRMSEGWQAQRGRGGEGGMAVNAMAAVDIALWDLAGKARGLPVYQLLGGAVKTEIMAYASASRSDSRVDFDPLDWATKTNDEMVQECTEYVERGFKAIKYGWGNHFGPDAQETLAAIREAIGPDVRLMLDFGCPAYLQDGWNVKDAIKVAKLLERYDIFFLEEALHPYDVRGFRELRQNSPIKIATGESLTTVRDFQPFIERRAVDIVQPDVQQMGLTQFLRVARRAEEAGILCIPHGPWSAILVGGHINALATLSNGMIIEYPGFASFEQQTDKAARTHIYNHDIVENPPVLKDGFLQLPEGPGLGLGNFVHSTIAELEAA